MPASIASQVRTSRSALGLSQRELGERVGLTGKMISRIEGGYGTTTDTLQRLASALGIEFRVAPAEQASE